MYVTVFFLADFLGEYYWTVYELVMRSYPDVSGFAAYLGWNVAIVFLPIAVLHMRKAGAKRFFHPLMLLPVLVNVPQFLLYIKYGGFLNNLWQVGVTTAAMVFCLQPILFHLKNKGARRAFPWFALLVLLYLVFKYGMWTSSCFDWPGGFRDPYLYCTIISSVIGFFFAYGVSSYYGTREHAVPSKSLIELRTQVLVQTVASLVIVVICVAGFFIAFRLRTSLLAGRGLIHSEGELVVWLFVISAVLILLVLGLLYLLSTRFSRMSGLINMSVRKKDKFNLIVTIAVTFVLMLFAVVYNTVVLYRSAVLGAYEDAETEIKTTATELENYLTVASTTLRVAADSVSLMEQSGAPMTDIERYIVDQTTIQAELFDENFTGIYAYVNGTYLDGLGWVPPEGYEPTERDWYKTAVEAGGEIVIVSPYVDAQTGSVVITIGKSIADASGRAGQNVVCLDVIVNHIQEVTEEVEISGKGYGMVVNNDGFIIAHRDASLNGQNAADVYGSDLLNKVISTGKGRVNVSVDGEDTALFIAPVMDQWYSVIVINSAELLEETYSQLLINIMVSLITFGLISFFYFMSYRNEQIYGRKAEEMNIQVVTALASAIDAKDNYTNGHSSRVAEYARMIADRAGYSKERQNEIYMIGLLHDVGKIGIPDEVINKPSRLTSDEYERIKDHSVIGGEILKSIKDRPKLTEGARWHHERYGGGGYPDCISGEQIPAEARIIAVADAYDAMTSRRSYRDVMTQEKVRSEIENGMGTQFDPSFAKIMLAMIDEDKEYTMREKTVDQE
ncbi:MAG: HD domain-containing protein [Firmicutes bacterium]|nr:HD domain-containing protein [Bacillota bacterium]